MIASIFTLRLAGARCLCSAPRRGLREKNFGEAKRQKKRRRIVKGTWRRVFCCVSGRQLGCQSAEYICIFRWVFFFSLPFSCGKRPCSIPRSLTSLVASNMLIEMTVAFHFIIDTLPFCFCFRTSHTTRPLASLRRVPVALCTSCLGAAFALGAKRTCRMRGLTLAGPRCTVPPLGDKTTYER